LLLRAARAGIPTLPSLVTDSVKKISTEIGFPVVVFAVNPFMYEGYKTAKNRSALYRAMKSLGMNYKFAVCVQPLKGEITTVKSFFGKCSDQDSQTQEICQKIYEEFKVPVCQLHIQKTKEKAYLSGLQPLRKEELSKQDLHMISNEVSLLTEQGEPFGLGSRVLLKNITFLILAKKLHFRILNAKQKSKVTSSSSSSEKIYLMSPSMMQFS
jgi:hypothetical protein